MSMPKTADCAFTSGYPAPKTVQRAYDEADLSRAIPAYRFFYPTVSIMGTWKGNYVMGADGMSTWNASSRR